MAMTASIHSWPELSYRRHRDTYDTVHLWTQIVGKIRLALTPWLNHSWHVPLYVSATGLTTSLITHHEQGFEIRFDFIDHRLWLHSSSGAHQSFALEPMSVATFYRRTMEALAQLGLQPAITPTPVELPDPVLPLPSDEEHASYDAAAMTRLFQALLQSHRVLTLFRSRFLGKASPVHFFWGAFDLAATRFSGRPAPLHPGGSPHCADWIMQEAYSHEVCSAGFWPGAGLGEAAFYAYAYPEPTGFSAWPVEPAPATYNTSLGEFILPYEAVRCSADPDATLLRFLESTYAGAATLADWDRQALERAESPGLDRG
ncbi:hypothetical protein EVJ50_13170 [Synechococcus sp. RSCCF101]|uniref:DUF5996 family protein n=1 Tax=Synechococcus sp. RSCCF101 TaxID=2511069 RepID=UPI00124830B1|nr:DUF5996 family protein [Synechococcus sp. RSCCF101]QEY33038.1 hypothetical protein EVJ50_13170 [Synechococcus sp. RSCCF101]